MYASLTNAGLFILLQHTLVNFTSDNKILLLFHSSTVQTDKVLPFVHAILTIRHAKQSIGHCQNLL